MNEQFWQSRWRENKTSFHEDRPNNLLQEHFHKLDLKAGDTIFVPLCGKAVDLDWLAEHGMHVVGVEFNEDAVREVFSRRKLTPVMQMSDRHTLYTAGAFRIFVGDFFDLKAEDLGSIDAIYDRAALVALPDEMRTAYAERLPELTGNARQLIVSYDYDQNQTNGPPFSVPAEEVQNLYDARYSCTFISSRAIGVPLSQRCSGDENVYLLVPVGN